MTIQGKMTIGDLLDNPKSKAVLNKHLPKLVNHPMIGLARKLTVQEVILQSKGYIPAKKLEAILKDIERI